MSRTAHPSSLVVAEIGGSADLVAAIVGQIAAGTLADGDRLPSTRALAQQVGVSRGTVVRAFDELAAAGFIVATHGAGTVISAGAVQAARAGARTRGTADAPEPAVIEPRRGRSVRDLRPGVPDAALVDQRAWRSAIRAAASTALAGLNPWEQPSPRLRRELSGHLRRHRSIAGVDPMLFDSSRSAIAALCGAFSQTQPSAQPVTFHMEDPGYRGAALMARENGLRVQFHPAQVDGLRAEDLPTRPSVVFLTPAHQYPLGYRMRVDRRVALIEWARRTKSLIIEDDYDGEFRYGVAPLPALATLPGAVEHVAYVGTSSKSVAPDLRVAWCVPPEELRSSVQRWLAVHRRGPSAMPADVLAEFIGSGAMDRHLARAGRVYSDRRSRLVTALHEHCPDVAVTGVEAGLHLCVLLPGVDDNEVVRALDDKGWRTRSLSSQCTEISMSGLVLNYARLSGSNAAECARTLATVLAGPV